MFFTLTLPFRPPFPSALYCLWVIIVRNTARARSLEVGAASSQAWVRRPLQATLKLPVALCFRPEKGFGKCSFFWTGTFPGNSRVFARFGAEFVAWARSSLLARFFSMVEINFAVDKIQ
jgi:hypothetical protein